MAKRINRTRAEEEEFLGTMKAYKEDNKKRRFQPNRAQSIRLMIQGAVFFGLLLLFDIGLRRYRYTGEMMETVFLLLFLMSVVGALQLPIGMYYFIKTLWSDVPHVRRRGPFKLKVEEPDDEPERK